MLKSNNLTVLNASWSVRLLYLDGFHEWATAGFGMFMHELNDDSPDRYLLDVRENVLLSEAQHLTKLNEN